MKLSKIDLDKLLSLSPEEKWRIVCDDVRDDGKSADLAILLGSSVPTAVERAIAAAELYKQKRVPRIVASGGVKWEFRGEELTEAEIMKRVMVEHGVNEEDIFLDNEARTTIENMICSTLVISREAKISRTREVIIVTSQSHMQRSMALAKALLPRKFVISSYPAYPSVPKEEWLLSERNLKTLDNSITFLKRLVDNDVVDDVEINI